MAIIPTLCFDNSKNSNIEFDKKKIVKLENQVIRAHGGVQYGWLGLSVVAGYLRIGARVSVNDHTLSNIGTSAFALKFEIVYSLYEDDPDTGIDESAINSSGPLMFCPLYTHENDNKSEQTVIQLKGKIDAIQCIIENNEDVDVTLEKLYIWPGNSNSITEEATVKSLNSYTSRSGYNTVGSNQMQVNMVIPVVNSLPDVNTVPEGAMFILRE